MVMDHCWNQALDAVDLYPPTPTKLKKSRKLSTRMTLGFGERLEYSMVNCRSREEQMKLETIKTPAMDPGYEDVISDFRTFVNGKKFYKRKGKTWKRGYLLYEPPGSDGASLISAMADFLEFNLYNLDLASFSSFSELKNTLLVGTWRSSVIAIHDLDDFDHCAGMLPNLKNEQLTGSCLLKFVNGLLSSCGDEQIIIFTTNNRDRHDAARRRRLNKDIYVHKSSPQPVALADEGEIVQLNLSRQKPLVDFEATNIKAYQSSLPVSNSEEKNTREAARRCMTESVCSFVDSMTSISSTDFDALDNRAHLKRAYHSGPIVFNSEKKDMGEGLSGECLTKSALSFDDSTKRKSLPFDVNLSSFSEHASQDFDDFDFVGFDYGAGMLPNLKDELDSLREKPLVDFDAPNIKEHGLLVSNSEEQNTREASTRRCMTESVCSLVDSMPSISSTDFDALDNRSHLGRAYQSGPIVFNSEQKDTREGLSGQWLTKSAPSFDDKQKLLSDVRILASSLELTSQDLYDIDDFDDFDHCAGRLPNLEDETSHSTVGHLSTKLRPVRCPKCRQVLPELANVPVYRCGGCNTVLQAKKHKNDQDKCSLKHNNGGDRNEYAQSNGKYIEGVNLLDEVASPTEPNHHKSAESEVDKSGNCLEEENGGVNFSDEVASSTELNHLGSEESSPVAGSHSEVDENKNCLEQEVVSSTELKKNEIEVSSAVVRAYSEANKQGICNGKQTGGVNISDEVVSSTELNDNEIKVSSPVVTAHSEANEHKKCMEQNNGRNQSEFGDFKLDCSKNTKSSGEISSSTELACQEIEESTPVIETNAQLDENSKSPMSLDQSQKRKLTGFDHVSSVDSLENIAIADCSSEFSVTHRDMPNFPTTSKFSNYVYEGSVSSYDGNDDQVPDPYLHRLMELEQPAMFTELGMDLDDNKGIIDNLLRFVRDKEIYKNAGKDWKRGYLLYDSPGTDRLSLIAAMANRLEFDIYDLDLTGLTSISELTNVLVSIRNHSLIAIKDFDHWAGKLPHFKTELTLSGLLEIIHDLLSSCGDEQIIVLTTNHNHNHNHIDGVDAALLHSLNNDLYIHAPSPQPKALPDGGEIVLLDLSEQKPSEDFDATNNRAYQSDVLVSNSEEKNTREASRRQCMPEGVPSLVDSTIRIPFTDFDALDNNAHLVRAYQSGPIVFNSEKKDMGEVLSRECLTKSVLSLDDSRKQKSLSDVAVTGKKSHIVRAYESGPVVSFSDDKNGGEALKRECITKSILGLEDLQQHSGGRGDDAAKSFCAIYDPGTHTADSLARISFEVLETLLTREQPDDCVPLLSLGRLTLEDCVQQEKPPDLPRVTQINGVEQRVTKLPRYFGGLTAQSASSSRWPIGLPDRGYIVLLDPLDQSTKHIEYVARADQCSPTSSLAEKKMVRKTLKRNCRTMSVIFEDNRQHFARRCEGDAKSLGVKQIKNQRIHQWPVFRQKWATRKGYSLGEERPFEVRRLSVDETLDSRLQLIHMSQFARSSPRAVALPDGGEIVRPTALSSSEFAATNSRAHLVSQDQSGSTASHYKCKNSRETSDKQGLEDLQQHFGCEYKHALKSLGVSGSMSKTTCKQHWFYWWPGQFENNEQQAFDATSNRAHLVKADEKGPTVSNALFLEDLRHQFGARCKDAVKGLHDSLAWKSFKVQDNLPLGEQSDTRRRSLTHKHCVRLKKSQGLPRSMLRNCAGGLAAQSDIGLPDGGHILSLSEKKIVRRTLKRKCRTMSVLSLEDHQQHVGRRWEDTVKFLGAKRICRQLVIHRETTAKRIHRQLGTRRWLFKQFAVGLPDGGHILYLPEKKIVRKTLKRKCRSISVLSLEDHKQHVDRRWEDAAKSHGAKRICRQLGIHRLSTAKPTHKQHGIHQWPFQRSAIGLPDGRHVLPLLEKKMVRKTLKRKCRSMSVFSLVDRQQHVDKRWEDATKNIGAKRICRQLVIHRVSIAKRICRQHGIHHRWPFERDRGTMKGYTLGDERPVEVIRLSTDGKLVSRLQVIYISCLGRFSPPPSTLPGREIVGHVALSSSQFATTNSIAQRVGQDQSGSASSDSENERTREQENPEEIYTSITKDDLLQRMGKMKRGDAAASLGISVSTLKRIRSRFGIKQWPRVRGKKVGRPPDQHGERNTSTACKMPLHNVHARMEGEPVGQNQEANEFRQDFMEHSIALNTENDSILAVYSETEAARGSSKWAFQLEGQTMQSTTYPYRDDLVFSQSQIASTKVVNENMGSLQDRRDLLASQVVAPQKEPLLEGHVFGFGNWTVGSCSDPASSQTMRTFSHATGSSENLENWLASMEEHLMEENVYGSSRSDPAPSQPMHTIHHTMATVPQIPTERQDKRSVELKATYGDTKIKFQFPLTSGINELKEVMSKILERKLGSFKVEYKDGYGEWILMGLDEHVREYLQLLTSLGNKVTELKVHDKVPNTTNFCDNCRCYNRRSLKRKRP